MMQAIVFPGQGSQRMGMLTHQYEKYSIIRNAFTEATEVLGFDLWEIIQTKPQQLNQTEFTQPILLCASIALWRLWYSENSTQPNYLAGHSLGEYSALVAAEVLSFASALQLVHLRGQLMQQAVPSGKGAMAAILGLDDHGVIEACDEASQGQVVSAVNFNAPGQVVIAGDSEAVLRAMETAKIMGAKRTVLLPISVPAHCQLMKPAETALADALKHIPFKLPIIPIIQNVDATIHTDIEAIRTALIAQVSHPVLWVRSMQRLENLGVTNFIECGPGKVLCGLVKRIIENANCHSLEQ